MPPDERSPLLRTVIVRPPRRRYTHSVLRRFCKIALTTSLIFLTLLFLLPQSWISERDRRSLDSAGSFPWLSPFPHSAWPFGLGLSYEELQEILLKTPREEKARGWSEYYTSGPHLAGKNLSQAVWTKERWQEFGVIDSSVVPYDVYLNYPIGHRLALLEKTPRSTKKLDDHTYGVKFECSLEEDVLAEDPTTGLDSRVPTFHGCSAPGNVTAQYVYVNYGTLWDFEDLVKANISIKGKIALAKYGRNFRGLKVKRAQELGMIGVVIYNDPQDDGNITEVNGYKSYPNGPARNPSSVQRGSVQFISTFVLT